MMSPSHANCIDACRACIDACEAVLGHEPALQLAEEARQHCADLCRSSIRLCTVVVEELSLRSAFAIQVCALGSVICRACAAECTTAGERALQACAAAAQRAAEACHAVARVGPAGEAG